MPLILLKLMPYLLIVVLGGSCIALIKSRAVVTERLKQTNAELTAEQTARTASARVQADLTEQVNALQTRSQLTITKLVKIPVAASEACVSDVLKEAVLDK